MTKHGGKLNLEQYRERMISTLKQWVMIPSLEDKPAPGAPFGKELARMLETALKTCGDLGFVTRNFDNYIGEAEMGEGSDEDALAILAHVDVVPVGDGWTRDPFGAAIEGNLMYGRGTSDDKGPLVAAFYAMLAVKEAGIPLRRKVKLIIGCDEESGWQDIDHYNKVATMPRSGFSPDATYPVIHIEKGGLHFRLSGPLSEDGLQVLAFDVGERFNGDPGRRHRAGGGGCLPHPPGGRDQPETRLASEGGDDGRRPAHHRHRHQRTCRPPYTARNAIGQMLITLRDLGAKGAIAELADKIGTQYLGEGLGIQVKDAMSGDLTCNMGIIRVADGMVSVTLDIRTPLMVDGTRVKPLIQDHVNGLDVEQLSIRTPHYVPLSSELVQGLLDSYHEVTGREKKGVSTGGGTYARSLRKALPLAPPSRRTRMWPTRRMSM